MEGKKRVLSKLPTPGSSKRVRLESKPSLAATSNDNASTKPQPTTVTRSATKRSVSTSSLRATASSAGKAQSGPSLSRQTSASGKALFTVGTKTAPGKTAPARPALRNKAATTTAPTTGRPASKPKASKSPVSNESKPPQAKAAKPKRAAWDTKGQLDDLRSEVAEMKAMYRQTLDDKENQKQQIVEQKTQEISSVESRLTSQLTELRSEQQLERINSEKEKDQLQQERDGLKRQLTSSQNNVDNLNDQIEQLTQELRLVKKEMAMLKLTSKEDKFELEQKSNTIQRLSDKLKTVEEDLDSKCRRIQELDENKRQHETERRKLHNTIQELKGNIRVFCRVRPHLKVDSEQHEVFSFPDIDNKKVTLTRPANFNESTMNETLKRTEKLDFSFDKVFEKQSGQAEVFEEISQLVQSALDGYNVCIFAYGQTGSGKTYTMQGPEIMSKETEGMIPRSIEQIFESAGDLTSLGWVYTMEASFLEIYNEHVRDLLDQSGKDKTHEIKSGSGDIVVTNLTTVTVTQPRQVENLFERATKNRAVAETQSNSRSSRSHSVFTLKISGKNEVTSETCVGTLNLVDLAGSERLKDSKSEGDRLKETQCINASLSALGNVIMSLAAKKSHIPYRDSKLTYLLQNSLGGNSKTLMFVNVSPNEEHFNESVNSLRFATKVNNCSIGTAKKLAK